MSKRRIEVITGSRAEYGILRPLLTAISRSKDLRLGLMVTGLHLDKKFGSTYREIISDGFDVGASFRMYPTKVEGDSYYGTALSSAIAGSVKALRRIRPDILVVFGDRLEPLAATLAAATLDIPIAHIHGGDRTDSGHIDESIRHSISRFAHIHFTATASHTKRLVQMGEEPWRIHTVGALGLDSIVNRRPQAKATLMRRYGLDPKKDFILCVFHPVNQDKKIIGDQFNELLSALQDFGRQVLIFYPNNDAGHEKILKVLKKFSDVTFFKVVQNAPHDDYIDLMRYASVLVGNSSSGFIETPSLKLPVLNVGLRNKGREHGPNLIFVKARKKEILKGLDHVLYDSGFRKRLKSCKNPYGDGRASGRIVKVLSKIQLNERLMQKRLTY